jgi:transcriptional regulator with XRE-family HTH domain
VGELRLQFVECSLCLKKFNILEPVEIMPEKMVPPPHLGAIVRKARKDHNLTLEMLAERCGVSKSMLSQIERGSVNPTFTLVWNLTQALGLDLSLLGERAVSDHMITHIPAYSTPAKGSADGKCVVKLLNPPRMAQPFEWYDFHAESGGSLYSQPHAPGTMEHLTCVSGVIEVEAGDLRARAQAGDTLRYRADQPHAIHNVGEGDAHAFLVVALPQ